MKTTFTKMLALVCLGTFSLGCEPRPVVEEPAEPAVEVETTDTQPADDAEGADVQVGGGEGVQVDVNGDAN
jgi:hypothetical protein